jgi:hypothetical protein
MQQGYEHCVPVEVNLQGSFGVLSPEASTVQVLLQARTFSFQVAGMVETLQHAWNRQEPLEVVQALVREALDRIEYQEALLVLLEELEARGVADPAGYLRDLVMRNTGTAEGLVDYRTLPSSHLVGIETPAAMRGRWRRAVWTIMQHNVACKLVPRAVVSQCVDGACPCRGTAPFVEVVFA